MPHPHLSQQDARHLHLAAQGLLHSRRGKAGKCDVLAAIQRMALLQIDTISVVARSPYLVLFSRLGAYDPSWLDQLLAEGALFEYWAHEACFVPSEDYRLLRHRMLNPTAMGWKYSAQWFEQHRTQIEQLLERVRIDGPVRSTDFARADGKGNGWWDWKPEKRHLEVLFTLGRLMVKERRNFQRVYDLAERVRPGWNDERDLPSAEHTRLELIRNSCRALGVVQTGWLGDYYRLGPGRFDAIVDQLVQHGELLPVTVEGLKRETFVHASLADQLALAQAGKLTASAVTLLSPFDPIVWDRKRARELFDFDYRLECYTPQAKRQYGYFVLPILVRGRIVGRLDAKAHRRQGLLEIKALYLESGVGKSARLAADLVRAATRLAAWLGTPELKWGRLPDGLTLPTRHSI